MLGDVAEAMAKGNATAVYERSLKLASDAGGTADMLSPIERAEILLESAGWLHERGAHLEGYNVSAEAFKIISAQGAANPVILARQIDELAEILLVAGFANEAAKLFEQSLQLTAHAADQDREAIQWRRQKLAEALRKAGNATRAEQVSRETDAISADIQYRTSRYALERNVSHIPAPASPAPPAADQFPHRTTLDSMGKPSVANGFIEVDVFYATHRKPSGSANPYRAFGHDANTTLTFGASVVTVPSKRAIGDVAEPTISSRGTSGSPNDVFTVRTVEIFADGARDLFTKAKARIAVSAKKELLVFLHGYRTSFASGLMRAAQLKVDLQIDGSVVLYSLPSQGRLLGYGYDRANASLVEYHRQLRDLLRELAAVSGAQRIHLVAHSLGSEMLLHALDRLCDEDGAQPRRRFTEIVFAAPDVDHMQFKTLVPRVAKLANRLTVYASEADLPLSLVGTVIDRSRAGFDAKLLSGIAGVDAVDTTAASSDWWGLTSSWGHWDFATRTIDDFRAVIWLSLVPEARKSRLKAQAAADGSRYWSFEVPREPGMFRKALECIRLLGIAGAVQLASSGIMAEKSMSPPGARLQDFASLEAEIALLSAGNGA